MIKSKLALIIDSFFISSVISIISFVWLRRIIKSANLVILFLIFINLLCFIIILSLFLKSNNKRLFKDNDEKFLKNCLKFLSFSDEKTYHEFICNLIECNFVSKYFFKLKNNFLYINLRTPLNAHDYFNAQELFLNNKKAESKLYFIYNTKEKSFDDVHAFSSLDSKILSSETIIKLMCSKQIYPIERNDKISTPLKIRLKNHIKNKTTGFSKSHFKEIFFSGISLVILSLISPLSTYYLIVGSILITLSIITLFKKDYKLKEPEEDFLFK